MQDLLLLDVLICPWVWKPDGGVMTKLIKHNTTILTRRLNLDDLCGQPAKSAHPDFRGRAPMTKDNNLLGKFQLDGIPPAPRGVPQIETTYDIDANGILNMSAADSPQASPIRSSLSSRRAACRRLRLIAWCRRQRSSAENESNKAKVEAKNGLGNYCFITRNTLNEEKLKNRFEGGDKEKIEAAVQETLDWLPLRLILFSRASTTRARCLEHASRSFALTTL